MMFSSCTKNSGRKLVPHLGVRVGTEQGENIIDVKKGKEVPLTIGTWNVRTLRKLGKMENLIREMNRIDADVIGLSEVRWAEDQDMWVDNHRIITSAANRGQAGVGIILNKKLGQRVIHYEQHSSRLITVKIDSKPKPTTILQVYMPTSTAEEEKIEEIYEEIDELIRIVRGDENLIVMGDWNAVVGEGREGNLIGEYGLGIRNERGERLLEFCEKYKLVIANTLFKNHKRRLYTWIMPGDKGRYQIDYIMVRQRFRNQVRDCKTCPGADIDSDHNLLLMKSVCKFKRLEKKKRKMRWDLQRLTDENNKNDFKQKIERGLTERQAEDSTDREWKIIKSVIKEAGKDTLLKINRKEGKKPWVTEEIIDLIDERKKHKNAKEEKGREEYRRIRNQINRKCKEAKEKWIEERCDEVEKEFLIGKTDAAYRRIRENFGENKPKGKNIKDKNGRPIESGAGKADRWREYIEELYDEKGARENSLEKEENTDPEMKGDYILRSEFDRALKDLGKGKTTGIDEIPVEILNNMGNIGLDRLYRLTCKIYETGEIPKDFCQSVIIPIPKKSGADRCEDYRTISLTTHASKILTKIVYRRMEHEIEEKLGEDQFGFRKSRGTREAILTLRLILEGRQKKGLSTYIAFVDLEKAFDNVNWSKMFRVLKKVGVKYRERRFIHNLYTNQEAVVRIDNEERTSAILKGVRQGCSLSSLLFNIYIEEAINEVKEKYGKGVKVHGETLKMLRFADDIVVLAESKEDLEEILNGMDSVMKREYHLKINRNKTKALKCGKGDGEEDTDIQIHLGDQILPAVGNFNYLGSKITKDGRSREDIKSRIAQAKKAFMKKRDLLESKINLGVRKKLLKTLIWSIALYGCETWTVGGPEKKRIEAFEMWCYRRMMKIRWSDKVRNEDVLERVGEERSIWKTIVRRRTRLVGHILRHPGIVNTAIEGSIEGKNCRGRPRQEYVAQIIQDVGCERYVEMKRLAQNRKKWRSASNQSNDC